MARLFYAIILGTLLAASIGSAYGQPDKIATVLELDPLPSRPVIGKSVTFSGHIETVDGQGVAGATIEILVTHDKGVFILFETVSNDEGDFSEEWVVENVGTTVDFEAHFDGDEDYQSSWSEIQTVRLLLPGFTGTEIEMDPIPPAFIAGEKAIFSGYLKTDKGEAIPNERISIEAYNSEFDFLELARAVTDLDGFFRAEWTARIGDYSFVGAHFEETNGLEGTYSNSYEFFVHDGSIGLIDISLDKHEYYVGEDVAMSGVLKQPSGAQLSVKVFDPSGRLYDSFFADVNDDGTFSDWTPTFDDLTGRYIVMAYHDGSLATVKFLLLNKAEVASSGDLGPFCESEYIQNDGGTVVGDIAMVGRTFTLRHGDEQFDVAVYSCGEEAETLAFNQQDRYVVISGVDTKQVEVVLPAGLIGGDLAVFGDDGSAIEFELSAAGGNNLVRIYEPGSSTVTIQGTTAIPEFPLATIMLAAAMPAAILLARRFKSRLFWRA